MDQVVEDLEGIVGEPSRSARLTLETALANYRNARLFADVQIDTLMSRAEPVPSPEA